ncbi:hypothetical protein GCM10011344_37290 [Dokdonia pacifica]|uniref:Uncharacterized protein n=1 Tax=Dokdonia pacifica TaxID=1627892 RepID=A0A239B339_9FLAO|nr:hypothetical protein [Dokdonia pacifica]GGG32878.1 hypothetical protein GCM10011344_37290 [Dokdonia pacifica]SNS01658.1 hypothetical protein SAMN06265376_105276 [Dokdonia pacifica]
MRYFIYTLVLSAVLLCSCSDTDDSAEILPVDTTTDFPDFSFFNFSNSTELLQYQFRAFEQMGSYSNIAALDGINPNIQRVEVAGEVVGLYSGNMVWLKNIRNGAVSSGTNFFEESDTEFRSWTINSEQEVFSGYNDSDALDNFRLRTISLNTSVVSDIQIGALSQNSIPAYHNGRLAFYENQSTTSGGQQSTLVLVNTDETSLIDLEVLEGVHIFGLAFGDANDFYVFLSNNSYIRYDAITFTPLENGTSSFDRVLDGSESIINGQLFYTFMLPEPSVIEDLPAVYDIASEETTLVDITPALTVLAEENGWSNLERTTMNYAASLESWLIGYRYTDSNGETQGGVAKFSNDAALLTNLEVTDHPWNLVVLD